jgi:thiol-disulfide isomerase/thioredoxin
MICIDSKPIWKTTVIFAIILLNLTFTTAICAAPPGAGLVFPAPSKITLVNFSAEYCFACRMLKPVLKKITDEYGGKLEVVNVDAENHRERAREMNVTAVPVLFFYDRDGRLHLRHEGFMKEESIKSILEEMGL